MMFVAGARLVDVAAVRLVDAAAAATPERDALSVGGGCCTGIPEPPMLSLR